MLRYCVPILCLGACLAIGQDRVPRSRVELLEQLQNNLGSAVAHAVFSYDDRVRINEFNAILARNIGAERGPQRADPRELKNMLRDIRKLCTHSGVLPRDRLTLERDCEELKYNLEHGPPVYRGYHQPLRY